MSLFSFMSLSCTHFFVHQRVLCGLRQSVSIRRMKYDWMIDMPVEHHIGCDCDYALPSHHKLLLSNNQALYFCLVCEFRYHHVKFTKHGFSFGIQTLFRRYSDTCCYPVSLGVDTLLGVWKVNGINNNLLISNKSRPEKNGNPFVNAIFKGSFLDEFLNWEYHIGLCIQMMIF